MFINWDADPDPKWIRILDIEINHFRQNSNFFIKIKFLFLLLIFYFLCNVCIPVCRHHLKAILQENSDLKMKKNLYFVNKQLKWPILTLIFRVIVMSGSGSVFDYGSRSQWFRIRIRNTDSPRKTYSYLLGAVGISPVVPTVAELYTSTPFTNVSS